ncbi:NAD-dependent epimerase/dehydratase family protein [Arthrobacter sp. SA17]
MKGQFMVSGAEGGTTPPLVVVTGAAGHVGQLTSQALAGRYRLRLIDLDWPMGDTRDDVDGVERRGLDLTERGAWDAAIESAQAVVHLAGNAYPEIGARAAVEGGAMLAAGLAAAAQGSAHLKRIVFASSIHTMGLYHREAQYPIRQHWPSRPCCEYGAAKVFSENLLEILTERAPVSVVCLRLGLTGYAPATTGYASQWLGPGDYAQLLHASLTVPMRYGKYLAVSAGAARKWDLTETIRGLGFHPSDPTPAPIPSKTGEIQGHHNCLMFRPPTLPTSPDHAED